MEDFINKYRLKAKITEATENPYIGDTEWVARHYSVEIHCGTRRATFYISRGEDSEHPPSLPDVLESLYLDSRIAEGVLAAYIDDMGLPSSMYSGAKKIYGRCCRTRMKLLRLFKERAIYDEFRRLVL